MADDFDAYYQWLGIRPKDQPPNHYRLLGIDLFESDANVIENAADRQMAHLRTFQTGPHGERSQKLLNEISAARVCLLKPNAKDDYDRQLKAEIAAEEAASQLLDAPTLAAPQPTIATSAWAGPQFGPKPSRPQQESGFVPPTISPERPRRQKPLWQQPIVVAGSLVGLLLLSLIVYLSTRNHPITIVDKSDPSEKTSRTEPPAKKDVSPPPEKKTITPPPPAKKKDGSTKTKTEPPKKKAKENGLTKTVGPDPKNSTDPLARDEANRKAVLFVIKHGGYVFVSQMQDDRRKVINVERIEEIPSGPFDVIRIVIRRKTEFKINDLRVFSGLAKLRYLDVLGETIDDDAVRGLQDLPSLTELRLHETQITHKCMAHLQRFKALRVLTLSGGTFADKGVSELVRLLPDLNVLSLVNTKVTDEGVAQLKFLSELVSVDLSGTAFTDRSAEYLSECKQLSKVSLREIGIGDDALKALARMPKLTNLYIWRTRITENGLAALAGAPKLRNLHLDDVILTETGFGHLGQIKGLTNLMLLNCGVTVERAGELQKMLPGCRIGGVAGYRSPK